VLGKNDIGEEIIATPSIADGRLFIRTRETSSASPAAHRVRLRPTQMRRRKA
jgi:hypothetical protein